MKGNEPMPEMAVFFHDLGTVFKEYYRTLYSLYDFVIYATSKLYTALRNREIFGHYLPISLPLSFFGTAIFIAEPETGVMYLP